MKLIIMSTMTIDIVLILTPNLVCTYILCIYNNMQQIQVDRNDAEDLLENEDDNSGDYSEEQVKELCKLLDTDTK